MPNCNYPDHKEHALCNFHAHQEHAHSGPLGFGAGRPLATGECNRNLDPALLFAQTVEK